MTRSLILSAIMVLFFSSCIQKRFLHNAPPVMNPMIKEKNEGYASAYYHSNGNSSTTNIQYEDPTYETKSNGLNLQGGYALTKHFAFAGGYSHLDQKSVYLEMYSDPFDTSFVHYRRNEYSFAGNFFFTNDSKKIGMNLLLGASIGKLKIDDKGRVSNSDYSRFFNANMLCVFLMPCFNVYVNENTAFGFNTKLGYLSYNNNKTNYSQSELSELRLDNTSSMGISEFGMKMAIGFNKVPLSIDAQYNCIINRDTRVFMRRNNFSTGLTYRWNHKPKKK